MRLWQSATGHYEVTALVGYRILRSLCDRQQSVAVGGAAAKLESWEERLLGVVRQAE
jgi:hypothetical protein